MLKKKYWASFPKYVDTYLNNFKRMYSIGFLGYKD